MANEGTIREQAIEWAVHSGDPAFKDWDSFTLWLEADPANAKAYDEVMASVHDAANMIAVSAPANDDANDDAVAPVERVYADDAPLQQKFTRRAWLGTGLAACLALVGGFWALQGGHRELYTVQTAMGETRSIDLEPGTRVDVAGGSTIVFDRKDARFAKLDKGQALFTVLHDDQRPFEVTIGHQRLIDIGTVFDVRHDDNDGLSVAVSEGAVVYDPDGAEVEITPGEILRRPAGSAHYTLSKIAIARVGEWREGRLTFQAASLSDVAVQLQRATGVEYVAAPGSTGLVSGSILTASLRQSPQTLGPLLGVTVQPQGQRWVIGTP